MTGLFERLSGSRRVRTALALGVVLAAGTPFAAQAKKRPVPAKAAAPVAPTVTSELQRHADRELLRVYAALDYRPVWVSPEGAADPAVARLIALIDSAAIDGIAPGDLSTEAAKQALAQLAGDRSPAALAQAELALSRTYVAYVIAMAKAPAQTMTYEHSSLQPAIPGPADALWGAASAPSLENHVQTMGWMHPLYATLRQAALAEGTQDDPAVQENLARIRALVPSKGKSIVVDTAGARLWMYEGDRVVDSMKVVVGKPDQQTPLIAGYVRDAIVNPYWNVPDDLVQGKIAANVLNRGPGYLKTARYEVLSGWEPGATLVNPATLDWRKIASGATLQRVRQLPGAANAMGRVKFEFPNPQGIYLHDTPDKALMLKTGRQFSSGCVRLEDADRLGRWLMNGPLPAAQDPETKVALPGIVPIYITYLTAHVENGRIAYGPDPYKRDAVGTAGTQAVASAR